MDTNLRDSFPQSRFKVARVNFDPQKINKRHACRTPGKPWSFWCSTGVRSAETFAWATMLLRDPHQLVKK
jgi:hypothetical protein